MAALDIEKLLEPVAADAPAGDNLEYDLGYLELETAARGEEERYAGTEVIASKSPDWKDVRHRSIELFGRTKDLRVAVHLLDAAAAMDGIDGLQGGVALIRAMVDRLWEDFHPKAEAEDTDEFARVGTLASLSSPDGLLGVLRSVTLIEAKAVGRFTFRDLDIADQRITAQDMATLPTLDLMSAAVRGAGLEVAGASLQSLKAIREDLRAIELAFQTKGKGGSPDFAALDKALGHAVVFFTKALPEEVAEGSGEQAGEGGTGGATSGGGGSLGGLRTREDVRRILEQVCVFLEQTEPSNPAPVLIRRAQRLLNLSFMEIMQDLAPEALDGLGRLAGTPSQ